MVRNIVFRGTLVVLTSPLPPFRSHVAGEEGGIGGPHLPP
jgi:hypothetical protein